ncbi:MAG TPA: 16S rRNA (cytosine(1402)-N(4))-methyltransferase [Clostridiales bacterium]|jgi:tRNA G37 N-methylase Trm5|nr:16S rRNA (cytosine(1402)-N(4))-methyltransferase [Clostridiales bacterium]
MNFFNFVELSHFLIDNYVNEGDIVVDCTSGNGFDSLYLCKRMQGKGFLFSFDIQKEATKRTNKNLKENCSYDNYKVINDSHSNINQYIEDNIDFAIYNLGYLPNSDSKMKTNFRDTIISLKKILELLKNKGIIVIVAYTGHDEGKERDEIFVFLKNINPKKFSVMNLNLINANKYPPEVFLIQKNA